MAVRREEWEGLIRGRADPNDVLVVDVPLQPSPRGGSGTFLAEASDNERWWVKPQNNLQGAKVVVTEYVIGSAGRVIGAPVCEVTLTRIPPEIAGWEFRPGATLMPGIACASRAVEGAFELRSLEHRERDDNTVRHAGVFALYDWCWGGDDQWLYCEVDDRKLYSHDHGWYLPETGPDWSESAIMASVDEAHLPRYAFASLDRSMLAEMSARLREPLREKLVALLSSVPASWAVSDRELEAVGFFLERRAPAVAERLDEIGGRS